MSLNLSLEQARALAANHRVVPVIETLFSGSETPLSIFEKLAADRPGSFLLESAEQGVWARYSFIGVNNRGTLTQANDGFPGGKTTEKPVWISPSGASALPNGESLPPIRSRHWLSCRRPGPAPPSLEFRPLRAAWLGQSAGT